MAEPRKRSRTIPAAIERLVWERDGGLCQVRSTGCTRTADCIDHIKMFALGGTHDPANLRLSCQRCNLGRPNPGHRNATGNRNRGAKMRAAKRRKANAKPPDYQMGGPWD